MQKQNLHPRFTDLPRRPGVYLFKNDQGRVLYVGKALSLKDRVSSYFQNHLKDKTQLFVNQIQDIRHIETGSEFEALLLEANLIKLHQPKYNVVFRDDKSYLYVFISTGEEFPKIITARKPRSTAQKTVESYEGLKGVYFGPFPSAGTVRNVLKYLRRIFPFCQQKRIGSRPCFYSHIGLCKPCPSYIAKQSDEVYKKLKMEYRQNIFSIKNIFAGKLKKVEKDLQTRMRESSQLHHFEQAILYRNQLQRLEYITQFKTYTSAFLENSNFYFTKQTQAITDLRNILKTYFPDISILHRIECFDISTLHGKYSSGSQVVFVDGIPEKSEYRRYRIKFDKGMSDTAMLVEMVKRRLNHDWPKPDLVIVDGGKPQVSQIYILLKSLEINIPVMGLAKQLEQIVVFDSAIFNTISLPRASLALQLLQQIRDEAHRFAIKYHRLQRSKKLIENLQNNGKTAS